MPLDTVLLEQAKAAEERVIDAEHSAEVARADFHRAIRRLNWPEGRCVRSRTRLASVTSASIRSWNPRAAAGAGAAAGPPRNSSCAARSADGTRSTQRR